MKIKSIYFKKITIGILFAATALPVYAINSGEVVGKHIFALARDYQGDPIIIDSDPLIYKDNIEKQNISANNSVFEIAIFDNNIGGVYISKLDRTDNYLNTYSLDLSEIHGISSPAGSTITRWNSVLFSESSLADSANDSQFTDNFMAYYKNKESLVNPYNYGWVNELVVFDQYGNAKVIKNYAVGRLSASHILAMPDNRTFYFLDANHSGHLYVFVSDKEKTMTSGTLYSLVNNNEFIEYFNMGDASALKMKFRLKDISFDKIFSYEQPVDKQCSQGYSFVDTRFGEECLKLKSKYKKYTGKIEPIRYAAISGKKPYFEDVEEISVDQKSKKLIILKNDGSSVSLTLSHNSSMNSDYIAEVFK